MGRINWKFISINNLRIRIKNRYEYMRICLESLFHNSHMSGSYAADVFIEPAVWIVDNYAHLLGPVLVGGVCLLTFSIVFIAYWIGLPYWYAKSPSITFFLAIAGNWILVNVVFHYVMAAKTSPGIPPEKMSLEAAVTICKKCIAPKPARTHHCSVCSHCILKMDHHCPWLNNCVGFSNHRYFFLYMAYTILGCFFLASFGTNIFLKYFRLEQEHWTEVEPLEGQPVKFNLSGHIIPVTHINEYDDDLLLPAKHNLPTPALNDENYANLQMKRNALIYAALILVAVVLALGALCFWHARLITRGESSVEAHINDSERKRLAKQNLIYINPYNFGPKKNWKLFLGLVRGRSFWRSVLLPSWHKPEGNGLQFHTVNDEKATGDEWP